MSKVVESIGHSMLEDASVILEPKGHDTMGESAPGCSEHYFILIHRVDPNLIVTRETIHEGE